MYHIYQDMHIVFDSHIDLFKSKMNGKTILICTGKLLDYRSVKIEIHILLVIKMKLKMVFIKINLTHISNHQRKFYIPSQRGLSNFYCVSNKMELRLVFIKIFPTFRIFWLHNFLNLIVLELCKCVW